MRIIVTGGAGFIGSTAVGCAVRGGHTVLTIDKLTYAGRTETLSDVMASPNHHFLQADIVDGSAMEVAFGEFEPDAVLHLAAESHVDRSILGSGPFVYTNVVGTQVLLDVAKHKLQTTPEYKGAARPLASGGLAIEVRFPAAPAAPAAPVGPAAAARPGGAPPAPVSSGSSPQPVRADD